jgi:hypothetical protein
MFGRAIRIRTFGRPSQRGRKMRRSRLFADLTAGIG